MKSNVTNTVDVESLTEKHFREILEFLEVRKRFEDVRMKCVFGLALICCTTLIFNQINDFVPKAWQTVLICVYVVMTGINEIAIHQAVSAGKKHLTEVGLPSEYIQFLAKVNIRRINKELAARRKIGYQQQHQEYDSTERK